MAAFIALFRHRDLSVLARAAWPLFVLVFPLIGSLLYLTVTCWQARGAHDMTKLRVTTVPSQPSTVADLARLDRLRCAGVLSEDEVEAGKGCVLEAPGRGAQRRQVSGEIGS